MELDRPEQWSLKGEGNANWVFAYTGTMPHLVRLPAVIQAAAQATPAVWRGGRCWAPLA
jgi:hypothetical protein